MKRSIMQLSNEARFKAAVHSVLFAGLSAGVAGTASAQEAAATEEKATELEPIEITGSRIRRVDTETASPVFTIDRSAIERSGVQTVSELVQELPAISGAATNPRVNNGGGTGAATVSLRGLGSERTLVLLNGRRMVSSAEAIDINQLPINLIERVEVLKEGASAIYGSDAIGGVVNFITRKDFNGGELSLDAGVSGESDGERQGVSLTWGTIPNGKSNLILGLNYHDAEGISAGDREFSRNALYLYGSEFAGGSSRTPTGRFFFPDTDPNTAGTQDPFGYGCSSVTRNAGAQGDDLADYHCYVGANDSYNYQPLNLILTPQERTSVFSLGNYQITEDVGLYAELFANNTRSGFQIAPLPFDTRLDDVVISEDNVYNPFDQAFGGGSGVNQNATFRMEVLGNRASQVNTDSAQLNLGLQGDFGMLGADSWRWSAGMGHGRSDQQTRTFGYLFQPNLLAALGPSFDAADGDPDADADGDGNPVDDPRCGTPGNEIDGCTPLNMFNLNALVADPAQRAQIASANASYAQRLMRSQDSITVNIDGPAFKLPAGDVLTAFGFERREQKLRNDVDFLALGLAPDFLNCQLAQETCTNEVNGKLDVTEYYVEGFVPIVEGREGSSIFNAIVGMRYSDYSTYGSTTNGKLGLEMRPVADVLVRTSWAEVFRAPTITDLYLPVTANAPTFNDPCVGLTAAEVAANPNLAEACENVPTDGSFDQPNGQVTGRFIGNEDLEAETGTVYTWGVVYDPSWAENLSLVVDFWNYELEDTIDFLDVNFTAETCVQTGVDAFCDLINRFPDGEIDYIDQPSFNLGELKAKGVDFGVKYEYDAAVAGKFRVGMDMSYIDKWERTAAPGFSAPDDVAGEYSRQDGNFARVRALAFVDWSLMGINATLIPRYIGELKLKDPDGAPGTQPDLNIDAITYLDLSVGYSMPQWKNSIRVGVDNLTDEQPPILYQNNVTNANTDVETYDTIGQFMWVKFTQSF